MNNEAREIERKALSLSVIEREQLANNLFQSVHNQELSDNDREWLSLAEERWNSYRADSSKGIEKKAFFSQIRDSLGWK
ncbi:addiction module protein [Puniceicoccaceae bacterium K14]|nr:addiction module protein [Puniceicoccaceae bacterium K14]